MKIVIASDSFKGTLSSKEVADIAEKRLNEIDDVKIVKLSISDGGEGFVQSILDVIQGEIIEVDVIGPKGNTIRGFYGIDIDKNIAIIEMAAASGLCLIPENKRNPLKTTTYGFGQLIKDALDKGVKNIVLGLGGSATNDFGAGMAEALGVKFIDNNNNELKIMTGEKLGYVYNIDFSNLDSRVKNVKFDVACDVCNPLTGKNGAAHVFASQKGASENDIKILDENLLHISVIIYKNLGLDINNMSGAGAAGGLGGGTVAFLNAEIKKGIDLVLDTINFDNIIKDADLIITGEGKLDSQSIQGKTPYGILKRAEKYNIPVIALCGVVENKDQLINHGFDKIYSIVPDIANIDKSIEKPYECLDMLFKNVIKEMF